MSIAVRTAETVWEGELGSGRGTLGAGSGAFTDQEVTWASRTERSNGKTSPEELCAAAHSSCFSMALALKLGEKDLVAERLQVRAAVTLAEVAGLPTIATSALEVEARVPNADDATFQAIVAEAAELCPVSRLFTGAEVTVTARLAQ
ncbi:OsmC family peroxiredoxin [Paraconexibacter sp.]|uniref:OsmC family peroxiredoxin n=1 Tax=Paraconexibacter sp. TaxID=2949640 RepID=UPI0035695A3F